MGVYSEIYRKQGNGIDIFFKKPVLFSLVLNFSFLSKWYLSSGGSRNSQKGCANPRGGSQTYYLANFSWKLHENEDILGGGCASLPSSGSVSKASCYSNYPAKYCKVLWHWRHLTCKISNLLQCKSNTILFNTNKIFVKMKILNVRFRHGLQRN